MKNLSLKIRFLWTIWNNVVQRVIQGPHNQAEKFRKHGTRAKKSSSEMLKDAQVERAFDQLLSRTLPKIIANFHAFLRKIQYMAQFPCREIRRKNEFDIYTRLCSRNIFHASKFIIKKLLIGLRKYASE